MASPDNPNQPGGEPFDIPKFFNPSAPSSTVMTTNFPTYSNFQNPSFNVVQTPGTPQQPFPLHSPSFPPPTVGPYSFQQPISSPFHNPPSQFFHPFHPQQFNASGGNPPPASPQEAPSQFSNHLHPYPHQKSVSFPTPLQPPLTSSPHPSQFPGPQNSNVNNVNNTNKTPGARLMALLSTKSPVLEMSQQPAVPMTHVQPMTSGSSDLSTPPSLPMLASGSSAGFPNPGSNPMRMPSSKLPRGRHLIGDHVVYDINVRLPGEVQPQLEVTPITKYGSDPGLVLGRQIAVNKTYICYGLKLGAIRVLNVNTALRSLLKGLAQRVTDMAFFAEDVHLLSSASVDGRVYIWKISEDPDEEDTPQITVKIVTAVQFNVDGESVHPRVCWHCHKQEVLVVGIGRHVLKIDTIKVGKGEKHSAEEPLKCPIDKLIDGIQLVGSHDGEVTDLSMCQWMTTRLVSASVDGTIKIWEDRKMLPIAVLRPYDGHPVNSVTFLTAPHRPDHVILITGGPLNQEVKIWISASEEGWLLPSDSESWRCIQTLELKSSSESQMEEAFFNQVIALSQVGLILLANAKMKAIYAVHLDFGSYPASSRMDYVAEFTVTMPILSFTGTSNLLPHGEQIVQVYCIQTQAIQQYALDLSQCLPPPLLENALIDKSGSNASRDAVIKPTEITVSVSAPMASMLDTGSSETRVPERHVVKSDSSDLMTSHEIHVPMSPRLSRNLSGLRSPTKSSELGPLVDDGIVGDSKVIESSVDRQMDVMYTTLSDVGSSDQETRIDGFKVMSDVISTTTFDNHVQFKHPTHLVTPSEILMAKSSSEVNIVSENGCDAEVNVQDEIGYGQNSEIGSHEELNTFGVKNKVSFFYSQGSDLGMQMAREARVMEDVMQVEETCRSESLPPAQPSVLKEDIRDTAKDVSVKVVDSDPQMPQAPLQQSTKGKKKKGKYSLGSSPLSPSPGTSYLSDPVNDSGTGSSIPSLEASVSRLISMGETLNQLVNDQKEMLKQMNTTIAVPVTKEGRRLEIALGKSIEKSVKANNDALWARFQEDNIKHEKSSKDRNQQMISLVNNCINKDLPAMVEKAVKRELANLGQAVARTIIPVIEKTVSSAIVDSFQKGVADKALNQLEKSLNAKLESTVARQIQTQFQTSGKQALQETLKSSIETLVVPAFEMSCKAMFEQVDGAFQKGMSEHSTVALQQFDSSHSSLILALRDALNSASSVTQILSGELADGQRKLLSLAANSSKAVIPLVQQITNGGSLGGGLHEKHEAPLDPTKELARLIAERKYEEAFNLALQRSDVSIVSWLCSQVDLSGLVSTNPMPLSQGVVISLLQQLSCDIVNDSSKKLLWMRDILTAINTNDPMIAVHVRPIFQQVYSILDHQRNIPTTCGQELSNIRLIMHVINSMLMTL